MVSFIPMAPHELLAHIAQQAQAKRLSLNLTQKTLSERSGVSFGVIKKFELTGKISLDSLLKIASILGASEEFAVLFKLPPLEHHLTLDQLLKNKKRKRGRK